MNLEYLQVPLNLFIIILLSYILDGAILRPDQLATITTLLQSHQEDTLPLSSFLERTRKEGIPDLSVYYFILKEIINMLIDSKVIILRLNYPFVNSFQG